MADHNLSLVSGGTAITAAETVVTAPYLFHPRSVRSAVLQSDFDYGANGTTVKVYLQTSLDGGDKWVDVAVHAFATTDLRKVSAVSRNVARAEVVATDGTLSDDTELDGVLGDRIRIKYIVVAGSAYTSTTLRVDVVLH